MNTIARITEAYKTQCNRVLITCGSILPSEQSFERDCYPEHGEVKSLSLMHASTNPPVLGHSSSYLLPITKITF